MADNEKNPEQSRQLQSYYKKVKQNLTNAEKVEVPMAGNERQQNIFLNFSSINKGTNEQSHYNAAKRLFDTLHRLLPAGVFKHFTMMIIEHDRKFNNYGDLL